MGHPLLLPEDYSVQRLILSRHLRVRLDLEPLLLLLPQHLGPLLNQLREDCLVLLLLHQLRVVCLVLLQHLLQQEVCLVLLQLHRLPEDYLVVVPLQPWEVLEQGGDHC